MIIRSVVLPDDWGAVEQLIADIEGHDRHPALGERKLPAVGASHPLGSGADGLVVEDDSKIFAYLALLEEEDGFFTLETVVRPDRRRGTLVDALLEYAIERVGEAGGRGLRLWTYVPEVMGAAERAGFRSERQLWHMKASLPLTPRLRIPAGIEIRAFREGVDETRWLDANNRIFSGHPENGNWELADLDRRRGLPWFSHPGLRMAWDGETLAGFCWTKTPSPEAGEIYVIGVLSEYQGMGLGRALLLEGAHHMLTYHNAQACVLYVDSANAAAVGMYRSMGFEHHHSDRSYRLQPGMATGAGRAGTLSAESWRVTDV